MFVHFDQPGNYLLFLLRGLNTMFNLDSVEALVLNTLFSIVPYSIYLEWLGGPAPLLAPLVCHALLAPYMVPSRPYIPLHTIVISMIRMSRT